MTTLRALVPTLLLVAACSMSIEPRSSTSGSTETEATITPTDVSGSVRGFSEDDVAALLLQDGDISGVTANHDGLAGPDPEPSDPEWTEHLNEHGLTGRWMSSLASPDEDPLGYPFSIGGRVSLWADTEAASAALAFENNNGSNSLSAMAPELGDGAACAVLDRGTLADLAWCRFAVANATFDVYIRGGSSARPELDPRAREDLARVALRLRQRAEERLATDSGP